MLVALLWSFVDVCRVAENFSCSQCMFPAEGGQWDALPSCFLSYPKQCPFGVSNCRHLSFASLCFTWVIFLFDVASQQRGYAVPRS